MTNSYFLAHDLIGFRSSTLRVKVVAELDADTVVIVTADLLDAGTRLGLDRSKLTPLNDHDTTQVVCHKNGLVAFA